MSDLYTYNYKKWQDWYNNYGILPTVNADQYDLDKHIAYIIDTIKTGDVKVYVFDGITKLSHSLQTEVDDDHDTTDRYNTHGVTVKAAELSMEVVMSDTCTEVSGLAGSSGSRSVNAFATLEALRKARRIVKIVTRLGTYNRMVLKTLAITEDEKNSVGWSGTITWHERTAKLYVETSSSTPQEENVESLFTNLGNPITGNIIPSVNTTQEAVQTSDHTKPGLSTQQQAIME